MLKNNTRVVFQHLQEEKTNNIPGKYVVPVPDYLKDRISGKSKTKDERVVTDEDEEAYKEMMSELTKGKERNDV